MFLYAGSLAVGAVCLALVWAWNRESTPTSESAGSPVNEGAEDTDETFGDLPETPTREDVLATLRKLTPYVAACGRGHSGVLRIHVAISGKTGTVTDAAVIKQFAGTDIARCATSIVEQAQFPRFRKETLSIVYPVTLPGTPLEAGVDASDEAGDGPRP